MIVESSYRGYRIEVNAVPVEGRWDATVCLRRMLTDDKPYVERGTCKKMSAELAERWAAVWAKRWDDLNGLEPSGCVG